MRQAGPSRNDAIRNRFVLCETQRRVYCLYLILKQTQNNHKHKHMKQNIHSHATTNTKQNGVEPTHTQNKT